MVNELSHPLVPQDSREFNAHQIVDGTSVFPSTPTSCLGAFNSCFAVYHSCFGKDLLWVNLV